MCTEFYPWWCANVIPYYLGPHTSSICWVFWSGISQKFGGEIRKVLRIDQNTTSAERGQFTRLSIELDLAKPLLSKFLLKRKFWRVQYEGLRMICFSCGKIDHSEEHYPAHTELEFQARLRWMFILIMSRKTKILRHKTLGLGWW